MPRPSRFHSLDLIRASVISSSSFMYMFSRFLSTSAVLSYKANTARKTALSVNFQKYSLILFRTMASSSESGEGEKPKHTNRLQHSKSPYLLQHKHNPVDWWGKIILKVRVRLRSSSVGHFCYSRFYVLLELHSPPVCRFFFPPVSRNLFSLILITDCDHKDAFCLIHVFHN